MIVLGLWLLASLLSTVLWCVVMRRRESPSCPEPRMLNVVDYGAVGDEACVPEGLGQSRRMDPGPVTWVELPADPERWLEAVAK